MSGLLAEIQQAAVRLRREGAGRLAADEAGAIAHERAGRHHRHDRCDMCARDGRMLLEQLAGFAHRPAGNPQTAPRASRSDPSTSHAAAQSISGLNERQRAVLLLYREHGWLTDEEAEQHYHGAPQSPSGLRTRRHELTEAGYLADTGMRRDTAGGRPAIVWGITAAGLRATRGTRAA